MVGKIKERGNLFVGLILGIAVGVPFALFGIEYFADNITSTTIAFLVCILLLTLATFAVFYFRENLLNMVFGKVKATIESASEKALDVAEHAVRLDREQTIASSRLLINEIVAWVSWARTKNWMIGTIIGLVAAFATFVGSALLFQQIKLLEKQNIKIENQNKLILDQNVLAESSRRSSLIIELSAILDAIDREINQGGTPRKGKLASNSPKFQLSTRLEGRIIALSRSLKPYRYYATDGEMTKEPLSPERGQLLLSLLASEIEFGSISGRADFSYADLANAYLQGAKLNSINLSNSNLRGATLAQSYLGQANLKNATLVDANFTGVKTLNGAMLHGANLTGVIGLDQKELDEARANPNTILPSHLEKTKLLENDVDYEKKRDQLKQARFSRSISDIAPEINVRKKLAKSRDIPPDQFPKLGNGNYWVGLVSFDSESRTRVQNSKISGYFNLANLEKDRITILSDREATKAKISESFFANVEQQSKAEDVVIFYFSGEIVSTKTNESGLKLNPVSSSEQSRLKFVEILGWFADIKAKTLILILDSEYSGSDFISSNGDKQIIDSKSFGIEMLNKELVLITSSEGVSRGRFQNPSRGMSLFGHYFNEAITSKADINNDFFITLRELQEFIPPRMRLESNGLQTAKIAASNPRLLDRKFFVATNSAGSARHETATSLGLPVNLNQIGAEHQKSISILLQELSVNNRYSREMISEMLGHIGEPAIDPIVEWIKPRMKSRQTGIGEAARALGWIGPKARRAVPLLKELESHSLSYASRSAKWALDKIENHP